MYQGIVTDSTPASLNKYRLASLSHWERKATSSLCKPTSPAITGTSFVHFGLMCKKYTTGVDVESNDTNGLISDSANTTPSRRKRTKSQGLREAYIEEQRKFEYSINTATSTQSGIGSGQTVLNADEKFLEEIGAHFPIPNMKSKISWTASESQCLMEVVVAKLELFGATNGSDDLYDLDGSGMKYDEDEGDVGGRIGVHKYAQMLTPMDWHAIGKSVGRPGFACYQHYYHTLSPLVNGRIEV